MNTTTRLYAQLGQEEKCAGCGLLVELTIVGHTLADQPVARWIAGRRTPRAPVRSVCPATGNHRGYHRGIGYSTYGAPR